MYALVAALTSLVLALAYFAFELVAFRNGQRGLLRGAIVFLAASVFAVSMLFPRLRLAKFLVLLVLLISSLGALDLVFQAPGLSLLGVAPRGVSDFDKHFDAAVQLYKYKASPYGPEGGHQTDINNLPFPTYTILWAASGFGRWGRAGTGLVFTFVNLIAASLTILASIRLSGAKPMGPPESHLSWAPTATAVFLIINSQLWSNTMMGQTPLLATCLLILALWLSEKRDALGETLCGMLLSLGIMIKPIYAPFLLYFIAAWSKEFKNHHYPRVLLYTVSSSVLLVLLSIVLPNGLSLSTYLAFAHHITFAVEDIRWIHNISLVGLLDLLVPSVPHKGVSVVLIVASALLIFAFERVRRSLSWPVWLVIPLLVSPITWTTYTGILLPAQLLVARTSGLDNKVFDSTLLVISAGMLQILKTPVGVLALTLMLYLTLRLGRGAPARGHVP